MLLSENLALYERVNLQRLAAQEYNKQQDLKLKSKVLT